MGSSTQLVWMRLLWARTFTISQMAKIIRYGVRRRFNEDVLEILRGYEKEDLRIAVIIAPIFIEIRLRTLISYALESRTVSRARFQDILKEDQWGFRDLLNLAWKRSEEHTSELQSLAYLVCRLL